MNYEIKHKTTCAVLFAGEGTSLREVVERAVRERANLRGANLFGADLHCANLRGANLHCANLRSANLSGAYLTGADLRGADLRGADLRGANLTGANLTDANLSDAYLTGANLSDAYLTDAYLTDAIVGNNHRLLGRRPVLMIGPIGSRSDYCTIYLTDGGVYVRAGCFFGALDAFAAAVNEKHGDNAHGREYCALIDLARVHAECWMPDVEGK